MIGVLARVGVALTTLAALAVPTLTFVHVRDRVQVGAQLTDLPEPPALTGSQRARYSSFSDVFASSIVVLGYHDVLKAPLPKADEPGRRVSISAANFAAHLRMLRVAGFESASATAVADYVLNGASLPSRSVMITFDGARVRDWTIADRILRYYGFRATVFIDPAIVDKAVRGTTLSWAQLRALVATGRWSVGVLPSTLAESVVVDGGGRRESGMVAHRWLADQGRAESTHEFMVRVRDALTRSRHRIVDEGLPSPVLMAYPFQAGYPMDRISAAFSELALMVHALFAVSLLTLAPDEVGGAQRIASRVLPRIEVYSSTTDDLLFARIRDGVRS